MRISDWSSDVCSSDLPPGALAVERGEDGLGPGDLLGIRREGGVDDGDLRRMNRSLCREPVRQCLPGLAVERLEVARSEEHTSELQSLMRISYAVFCLKKKNKNKKVIYCLHMSNTTYILIFNNNVYYYIQSHSVY